MHVRDCDALIRCAEAKSKVEVGRASWLAPALCAPLDAAAASALLSVEQKDENNGIKRVD